MTPDELRFINIHFPTNDLDDSTVRNAFSWILFLLDVLYIIINNHLSHIGNKNFNHPVLIFIAIFTRTEILIISWNNFHCINKQIQLEIYCHFGLFGRKM